jgi:hypothetical protein
MTSPPSGSAKHDEDYTLAWERYRRLSRARLLAWLGFLPFGATVSAVGRLVGLHPKITPLFLVPWFAFAIVAAFRAGSFQCPHCHDAFFYRWYFNNPMARHCMNCGFPKWAKQSQA